MTIEKITNKHPLSMTADEKEFLEEVLLECKREDLCFADEWVQELHQKVQDESSLDLILANF